MKPAVFLTGASGFLGGELARSFARDGFAVHALVRSASKVAALEELGATLHTGDVRERASVEAALDRVLASSNRPTIVHAAAVISYRTRDAALQRAVNVEGTRHVLDALRGRAIGRVLHVSSVVAVGVARSLDEPLDEDATFNAGELDVDYVNTKREAELLALAAADELDLVVVNPGAIFGPGGAGSNTLRFLDRVARGTLAVAPPGSLSPVSVEDVARGCRSALERGVRGRRYLLVESSRSLAECFRLAAREFGRERSYRAAPTLGWRASTVAARALDRLRALELLTPQSMTMLGRHFAFRADRARRELDWKPERFEDFLARTVRWASERGLVPQPRRR